MMEYVNHNRDVEFLFQKGAESNERKIIDAPNGRTLLVGGKEGYVDITDWKTDPPKPESIKIFTLTGLIDFIVNDPNGYIAHYKNLLVHVESPESVALYSCVDDKMRRVKLASLVWDAGSIRFNQFLPNDTFIIELQTRFVDTENRKNIMALAGNIIAEESVQVSDDGVSQRVALKKGIGPVQDGPAPVKVVNPVFLTPIRTFPEVTQVESPFVLRFKYGGECALYECDGGAWKQQCVRNICEWILAKITEADNINSEDKDSNDPLYGTVSVIA